MPFVTLSYLDIPPDTFRNGVVTIGNFDGVHLGHRSLLDNAIDLAKQLGTHVVPVTFDPHPIALLRPDQYELPMTTIAERVRQLELAGAANVVVLRTTPELLALSAEYFFETIVRTALRAKGLVEGFNFCFGHNRRGNNALLTSLCNQYGVPFREAPAFNLNDLPVSSSRVREAIRSCRLDEATQLLGRHYRISGNVSEGAKRGRTIGFPTANLADIGSILPSDGVFAVRVQIANEPQSYAGAANIGPNPTFGDGRQKVEIHLINFAGDLYGKELHVELIEKLRDTQKFASVDALVAQMKIDIGRAMDCFKRP